MDDDSTQDLSNDAGTGAADGTQGTPSGHPAWQEILDQLPESLHPLVTPKLQEWDKGVQDRFQKLHEEYKPLEDFKQYDPEVIQQGLLILDRLNTNPQEFYQALQQSFGFDSPGNQGTSPTPQQPAPVLEPGDDGYVDPQIAALKAQLDELTQMQQQSLQQQQAERQRQDEINAQKTLDDYLAGLVQKYGEFDSEYVVALMATGVDGEQAVQRFNTLVGKSAAPVPAPKVVSGGGGGNVPAQEPVNLGKLKSGEVQDMVAQILAQAHQE